MPDDDSGQTARRTLSEYGGEVYTAKVSMA